MAALAAALVVLFGVLGALIWRDSVREAGGRIVELIRRQPVVPTAPGHLGIAVAGLEGDKGGAYQAMLRETLSSISGVEMKLPVPPVTLATDPSGMVRSRIDAPGIIASAGAAALVWGQVTTSGGVAALQLFWTDGAGPAATHFDDADRTVPLPALDWDMLRPVLVMLAQSRVAALTETRTGQYPIAVVQPSIDQVRSLREQFSTVWPADTAADVDMALAEVLRDAGEYANDDAMLKESTAVYQDALTLRPHAEMPQAWAAAEDGLGMAYAALGRRQVQTENLEAALQAFQDALQERTKDHAPLQFAATEHNLGLTYWMLGQRTADHARLAASARANEDALSVLKEDTAPLEWAAAQNDLGIALTSLAEHDATPSLLPDAIKAYEAALVERSERVVPLQWAATKNNLAVAEAAQAERKKDAGGLKDAIADYQDALRVRTRDRAPLAWAETQHNLGNALTSLGDGENATGHLQDAITAYRNAVEVLTRDKAPTAWASTEADLGIALTTLGQREKGPEALQQAIAAYALALQVQTQTAAPFYWAATTGNQGIAMMLLADRTNDQNEAKAAVQEIQSALDGMRAARIASGVAFYEGQLRKARSLVNDLTRQ